eukprot:TRINITY_DN7510_c0_g3_i1.p1 TRINITY_DN7510_c0_g3~~TRINITY_DN7510_c0_g3_i1.p1  ORF type:complete len:924 (-),score=173.33 TRINITY_DN7510_c0_g3_i1:1628-4399(-)
MTEACREKPVQNSNDTRTINATHSNKMHGKFIVVLSLIVLSIGFADCSDGFVKIVGDETITCEFFVSWNGTDSLDCGLNRTHPCQTLTSFRMYEKETKVICIDGNGSDDHEKVVNVSDDKEFWSSKNTFIVGIGSRIPKLRFPPQSGWVWNGDLFVMHYLKVEKLFVDTGTLSQLIISDCSFNKSMWISLNTAEYVSIQGSNFTVNNSYVTIFLKDQKDVSVTIKDNRLESSDLRVFIKSVRCTNTNITDNIGAMNVTLQVEHSSLSSNQVGAIYVRNNSLERFQLLNSGSNAPFQKFLFLQLEDNYIQSCLIDHRNVRIYARNNDFVTKTILISTAHVNVTFVDNRFHSPFRSYHSIQPSNFLQNTFYEEWTMQFSYVDDEEGRKGRIDVEDCTFLNKLAVTSLPENVRLTISQSTFVGRTKEEISQANPLLDIQYVFGSVIIRDSNFSNHYGGAISAIPSVGSHPLLEVYGCNFFNCSSFYGGAIMSHVDLSLGNSHFSYNKAKFQGDNLWASKLIALENVDFATSFDGGEVISLPLERTSNFNMSCNGWNVLLPSKSEENVTNYRCGSCGDTFYTTGSGEIRNGSVINPLCLALPDGLNRVEKKLLVEGDHWCTSGSATIECFRCPRNYCNSQPHQLKYGTSCINNRTGTLCGRCKEGTTISLLGSKCVDSSKCNAIWISPFVIKSVAFFVLFWLIPIGGTNTEWSSIIYVIQTFPLLAPSNKFTFISLPFAPTSTPSTSFTPCISEGMTQRDIVIIQLASSFVVPLLAIIGIVLSLIKRRVSKMKENNRSRSSDLVHIQFEMQSLISNEEVKKSSRFSDPSEWVRVGIQSFLLVYSTLLADSFQLIWCFTIQGEDRLFINGDYSCNSAGNKIIFMLFVSLLVPFPLIILLLWKVVKWRVERRKKEEFANGFGLEFRVSC